MANVYDFSTDKINIFFMLVDRSGSMSNDESSMREGIRLYRESFENFPEANSIAVSICQFEEALHFSEFRNVKDLNFRYSTGGGTALYRAIVEGYEYLDKYVEEVIEHTNCEPQVTFILLSDGENTSNYYSQEEACKVIEKLNLSGANTVFCAFGNAIRSEFGSRLGFISTINIKDRNALKQFLGVDLSNSCKEQSKSTKRLGEQFLSKATTGDSTSHKGLGSNFFSKAIGGKSEGYSQKTELVMDDDDSWMDQI